MCLTKGLGDGESFQKPPIDHKGKDGMRRPTEYKKHKKLRILLWLNIRSKLSFNAYEIIWDHFQRLQIECLYHACMESRGSRRSKKSRSGDNRDATKGMFINTPPH